MKPRIPVTVYLLAGVACAGLLTQFLAAESAFALVGRTVIYSIAAALLIEFAIVVDAIVVARNRNVLALAGLVIAMAVSAVYNYTLADMADPVYTLQVWQKLALALGPLFALIAIGLALGEELYQHSVRIETWEAAEQVKRDYEYQEVHKTRLDAQDRQRAQVAFDRDLAREQMQFEQKEQALATRRAERHARKLAAPAPSGNGRAAPGPIEELLALEPYALQNHTQFGKACTAHPGIAARITPRDLASRTGQSTRTARRWCAQNREA